MKPESSADSWLKFFTGAGIATEYAEHYAVTFSKNQIQLDMLPEINKDYLNDMGISLLGHVIAILRHAKLVHADELKRCELTLDKLNKDVTTKPVAAGGKAAKPTSGSKPVKESSEAVSKPSSAPTPKPSSTPAAKPSSAPAAKQSSAPAPKSSSATPAKRTQSTPPKAAKVKRTPCDSSDDVHTYSLRTKRMKPGSSESSSRKGVFERLGDEVTASDPAPSSYGPQLPPAAEHSTEKKHNPSSCESQSAITDDPENIPETTNDYPSTSTIMTPTSTIVKRKMSYSTPSQKRSEEIILALNSRLSALKEAEKAMPSEEISSQIMKTMKDLEQELKSLKRKQQLAEAMRKCREKKRNKLAALAEKVPEIQEFLKQRPIGRPSLEEDQPDLHKAIMEILSEDVRGPTDIIKSKKTLSELHEELARRGFNLSRSSTYLRLLPKNSKTFEGKRHVRTVPVKLSRSQSEAHHHNADGPFATASIRYLEGLASVLGPQQVFFLSKDDKAGVSMSLTSTDEQAPLLMQVEDRPSKLPPDDEVENSKKQLLIPSVYEGVVINPDEIGNAKAVSYSGPTYVAIRSGKNSSSTAASHARDFEALLGHYSFQNIAKTEQGKVKPVVIITTDGGPDEDQRFPILIVNAIKHFMTHDLDAVFIATNAPGRSAYDRVERRLAPLSRELAGLILPRDVFGSHLNEQGETVDPILEEQNFQLAGEALAQVWNEVTIDNFPVTARYILPNEEENVILNEEFEFLFLEHDPYWYKDHVRESEYFLQIVKCQVEDCCGKFRSGLLKILPQRFFPPPVRVTQSADDLLVERANNKGHFLELVTRRALDLPLNENNKYLQVNGVFSRLGGKEGGQEEELEPVIRVKVPTVFASCKPATVSLRPSSTGAPPRKPIIRTRLDKTSQNKKPSLRVLPQAYMDMESEKAEQRLAEKGIFKKITVSAHSDAKDIKSRLGFTAHTQPVSSSSMARQTTAVKKVSFGTVSEKLIPKLGVSQRYSTPNYPALAAAGKSSAGGVFSRLGVTRH